MKTIENILDSAVEKLKNNDMDMSLLDNEEKDFISFITAYETLVNQLEEDSSISNKIKCEGKMIWLKTVISEKYPQYKTEINNYRKG